MKFVEKLMDEVFDKRENLKEIITLLRKEKNVYIWGTGMAGKMIYDAMVRFGINVEAFIDNNIACRREQFCGKKVIAVEEVPEIAVVIIAANVKYKIHEQVLQKNISKYYYIDPVYTLDYDINDEYRIRNIISENAEKINCVYAALEDDDSKRVFENVLKHRMLHDLELIWDVYDEHQYFNNSIVHRAHGVFVDCGAYQGDTLLEFLEQVGNEEYSYFAFEAERSNFDILQRLCRERNLENVKAINLGVWDKKDYLYFQDSVIGEVGGKVTDVDTKQGGTSIEVDSIDNILINEKIDFIKMDIEGAEIKALNGAKQGIKKNKPILAISAYHELEHLWEVPLLIKEINPEYRLYFGHHMWNMADTVCYAVE